MVHPRMLRRLPAEACQLWPVPLASGANSLVDWAWWLRGQLASVGAPAALGGHASPLEKASDGKDGGGDGMVCRLHMLTQPPQRGRAEVLGSHFLVVMLTWHTADVAYCSKWPSPAAASRPASCRWSEAVQAAPCRPPLVPSEAPSATAELVILMAAPSATKHTVKAGYIAPHPSLRQAGWQPCTAWQGWSLLGVAGRKRVHILGSFPARPTPYNTQHQPSLDILFS